MERKRTPASIVPWAVAFLLMALVLPASLHAQETRGRILGRVTDTSKAVIPGATVTVTDVARGTTAFTTDVAPILAMARHARGGAINPVAVYRDSRYRQQLARDRPADLRRGGGIV